MPSEDLAAYLRSNAIGFRTLDKLGLGFGQGKPQYELYDYPAPADDETMGLFCEWHTDNFFDVDTGPHVAIGLRGPVEDHPHRGRGLAIGILASETCDPENPDVSVPLFRGCPEPPGGPSLFIEDFSLNDGIAPVSAWQLSPGRHLPELLGYGIFRIDIHVSREHVWAGVWKVTQARNAKGRESRVYTFLDQVACSDRGLGFTGAPCAELAADKGQGNAFIGAGFADPDNRSWVDHIHIAHWKNRV